MANVPGESSTLRLLIATPRLTLRDGQGRVNVEFLRCWLARGHRVTALTRDVAPELLAHDNFSWLDLRDGKIPSMLLRNQVFAYRSSRYIARHRAEFDIVNSNGGATLAASDINSVHYVHRAYAAVRDSTGDRRPTLRSFYYRALTATGILQERIAFQRAANILAISSGVRDQLIEAGVSANKITVIWNGIDTSEFAPGTESRTKLGLPPHEFLALFAGDLASGRKNLDTVLRALTSIPNVRLIVAGKIGGSPYPRMAQALGLSERVHFLGFRRDIAEIMRSVDAFVYPAIYEPLGLVVLEALASGLPVITAKTTGAAALIDSTTGIVVENPRGAAEIAKALTLLVGDRDLRARYASAGRALAEHYTWDRMANQYVDYFEHIARSGR